MTKALCSHAIIAYRAEVRFELPTGLLLRRARVAAVPFYFLPVVLQ